MLVGAASSRPGWSPRSSPASSSSPVCGSPRSSAASSSAPATSAKLKTWAQADRGRARRPRRRRRDRRRRRVVGAPRRARPHLGLGPRLRSQRPAASPWPSTCVASSREDAAARPRALPPCARAGPRSRSASRSGRPATSSRASSPTGTGRPRRRCCVDEEDGEVVGFGGVEVAEGFATLTSSGRSSRPATAARSSAASSSTRPSSDRASSTAARASSARSARATSPAACCSSATGFHPRGRPKAVFRLAPEEHRPWPNGPEGVEVRRGDADDLEPALRSLPRDLPRGPLPGRGLARRASRRGSVYLAERDGRTARVPQHRPERPLGLPDRRHRAGALARRRPLPPLARRSQDYWTRAPRRGPRPLGGGRQPPRAPAPAAARASRPGSCCSRTSSGSSAAGGEPCPLRTRPGVGPLGMAAGDTLCMTKV